MSELKLFSMSDLIFMLNDVEIHADGHNEAEVREAIEEEINRRSDEEALVDF